MHRAHCARGSAGRRSARGAASAVSGRAPGGQSTAAQRRAGRTLAAPRTGPLLLDDGRLAPRAVAQVAHLRQRAVERDPLPPLKLLGGENLPEQRGREGAAALGLRARELGEGAVGDVDADDLAEARAAAGVEAVQRREVLPCGSRDFQHDFQR